MGCDVTERGMFGMKRLPSTEIGEEMEDVL